MSFPRNWMGIFSIFFTLAIAAACIPNKQMTVGSAATLLEDVSNSANKQSDLRVVREGMPAYLMLIDGMVEAVPNNARLLITGHEPCCDGYQVPNSRQVIIDSQSDNGCYVILPLNEPLSLPRVVERIERLT